jgi:hypothetical protein
MPAAGVKQVNFGHKFRDWASQVSADYGFSVAEIGMIFQDTPDVFSKSIDRSVTGSMVDYAKILLSVVEYTGGLKNISLSKMNDLVNECPMSKIGMKRPVEYLRKQLNARGLSTSI